MTTPGSEQTDRRAYLVQRLSDARARIAAAAARAGRPASEVTVIAVTKTWPSSDVRLLADLGVTNVGENKAKELVVKAAECQGVPLTWHFVGQLQRNKVKQVVPLVNMIHSVDRSALVAAIDGATAALNRVPMKCLVQVNLDPSVVEGRAGVAPAAAIRLADEIAAAEHLTLAGVMAVAPRDLDPRPAFDTLREVSGKITDQHRSATIISAGMSGDFVPAIAAGATHIRLGSALLGERAGLVR